MTHDYPPIFQYSQSNLQDYLTCKRRFQLRHLFHMDWPAPLLEPLRAAESEMRLGAQFHRLAERFYLGLPVEPPADEPLAGWWDSFRLRRPRDLPGAPRPEAAYSVPFADRRLTAKFDLIAVEPGERIVIVDWKTSANRPKRAELARRVQTLVYLYMAVEALAAEFDPDGDPVPPEAVSLVYWFANAPDKPETFTYSAEQHTEAATRLDKLIGEIENRREDVWPLTKDLAACQACNYRSYCERGVEAATLEALDAPDGVDWDDLGAINEVEL